MRGFIKKRAGFTLLELTVATAIFAFFLTTVVIGTFNIMQLFQKANSMRGNSSAARSIIAEIRSEAQFADTVTRVPLSLDDGSVHLLKSRNYTQGDVYGLCIKRNAVGEVMYYVDYAEVDPDIAPGVYFPHDYKNDGSASAKYPPTSFTAMQAEQARTIDPTLSTDDTTAVSDAQIRHILSGAVNPSSSYYFSTKRVIKSSSCSDPYKNFQIVGSSNNSAFDNSDVQFLRFVGYVTGPDFKNPDRIPTTSILVQLMVTQKGPPGRVTNPSRNPGKEFDDSLYLTTLITPNLSTP